MPPSIPQRIQASGAKKCIRRLMMGMVTCVIMIDIAIIGQNRNKREQLKYNNGGSMAPREDDLFMDELEGDFLDDENRGDQATVSNAQNTQQEESKPDDWLEDEAQVPGQLAVDVYQTKEDIYVIAPVPGVSKADLDLSIVESTLTVRGARKESEKVRTSDYFVQECYWGEFSRSIILPVEVKEEEAEAELKDGMLTVKIPKAEQDKVKKIDIA